MAVKVWLKLELPEAVVEDIAGIQDPVQRLSWVKIRIDFSNLRDIRTSEFPETRPGIRIKPKEIGR